MIWLILSTQFGTFSLANAKQQNEYLPSSLPDSVRVGATIVSRFLNQKPPRLHFYNGEEQKSGFVLAALRLMGVDVRKINDFAFDGIISMVHLVRMTRVLLKDAGNGRKGKKSSRDFSFFRFILGQPQVADLLKHMQDPHLVDLLLKESEKKLENFPEENTECIRLLICKTKPFVRGMQRSLRFFAKRENVTTLTPGGEETCPGEKTPEESCGKGGEDARWEKESLEGRMYFFLPNLRDVIEEGDDCDRLFPNCVY